MFVALITAVISFLESSTFAAGLHFILSEFQASPSAAADADKATEAIAELLSGGMSLATAIESVMRDMGLSAHVATQAGASAAALMAKAGTPIASVTSPANA